MARLKAASLINTIQLARALLGEPAFSEWAAELPEPTRQLLDRRLLAVEWIEADVWLPFQTALWERHFGGDEAAFRAFVRKVCQRDFNTFYKLIIRLVMSPESLLERSAKLWSTYSDDGQLVVREDPRKHVQLQLQGFHTAYPVMGVLLHAFVEQLLQMSGAKRVEVQRPSNAVHEGVLHTELRASWS